MLDAKPPENQCTIPYISQHVMLTTITFIMKGLYYN